MSTGEFSNKVVIILASNEREREVGGQGMESNYYVPLQHSYHAQVSCQPQNSKEIYI